jgi:6,7-dimethyl-8-ribityllumazine synthase
MHTNAPNTTPQSINPKWRIGIIGTQYYSEYIERMINGATTELLSAGITGDNITIYQAYGSWEVPLIGSQVAKNKMADALIGFGIIVQGETYHDQHLAREASRAMMDVQTQYGVPFGYELLHVKHIDQLPNRVEGEHNKGKEAAQAIMHALVQLEQCKIQ